MDKHDQRIAEIFEKAEEIGAIFHNLPDEVCDEIIGYFFTKRWQYNPTHSQTYTHLESPLKSPTRILPRSRDIAARAFIVADWYSNGLLELSEKEDV